MITETVAVPMASAAPPSSRDGGWFFEGVEGHYRTASIEGLIQTLDLFDGGAAQHELAPGEAGAATALLAASLSKLLQMRNARWSVERDKVRVEGTSEQVGDVEMIFQLQSNGDLVLHKYGGNFGDNATVSKTIRFFKQ